MKITKEIEEFINLTITEHMGKEYAKAKYNRPDELAGILEDTFTLWDAE